MPRRGLRAQDHSLLVGYLVRKKLGLKTERRETGYVIRSGEKPKLERLLEKYGLSLLNSMNSGDEAVGTSGVSRVLVTGN